MTMRWPATSRWSTAPRRLPWRALPDGLDITLTFDNGPEPSTTPHVLDVLARRGLQATFCVLGARIARPAGRALIERAADEGHWIANHTYTHSIPFGKLSDPTVAIDEIDATQELLGDLAHPDRLFRPFGGGGALDTGLLNSLALEHLEEGGYTVVTWNAVPGDWRDPDGWVEVALRQCTEAGRAVLVLHDLPTGAMAHLDRFLDAAEDLGARFPQEPAESCVLLRRGEVVRSLDGLMPAEQRAA
jgi:peptidoglycan/xylan/chitin deacetylase (PgdA/CDA1 family)